MPDRERVLVAGAGFAGVRVAKALEAKRDVTLVAPTRQFVYLPLIHEVLSENVSPRKVARALDEVLPDTTLVYGRAERVVGKELVTHDGEHLPFDKLVVAVGAEPNDFGVPGVKRHALPFYSVGDALMANATLKQHVAERGGARLRVAVVGASFTGVEVAGEAAELLREIGVDHEVVLLDAMDTIFPQQSQSFREGVREGLDRLELHLRLGQRIVEVREHAVVVAGDDGPAEVPADVTFWCAGAKPRQVYGVNPQVRPTLQSIARDDVFVVGDAASFPRERAVPKLAQTAEDQAKLAARNLLRPDDMRAYEPNVKGLIVSIGHGYAVAELKGGAVFTGAVPWHVKRQLYKARIRLA